MNKQEAKLELEKIKKESGFQSMSDNRWKSIIWDNQLSENFILVYQDKLDFDRISYYQDLSVEFILSGKINIHNGNLAVNKYTTIEKYEQLKDVIAFDDFLRNEHADIEFLLNNKDKLDEENVGNIRFECLTENAVLELLPLLKNEIRFYTMTTMTKAILTKFENQLDWDTISKSSNLTEEALIAFEHKIDWEMYVWANRGPIPEQIINEKFLDGDRNTLAQVVEDSTKLSEKFIRTHYDKFDTGFLISQENTPIDLLLNADLDYGQKRMLFGTRKMNWEDVETVLDNSGTDYVFPIIYKMQDFPLEFYKKNYGTKELKQRYAYDKIEEKIEENENLNPNTRSAIEKYEKLKNMFS